MAIVQRSSRHVIDLTGPDGNAWFLLGLAQRYCSQLNKDYPPIRERMMSGNYTNLVKVFNEEFGHVVDLILPDNISPEEVEAQPKRRKK